LRFLSLTVLAAVAALLAGGFPAAAGTVRDVVEIKGMREHEVLGIGLVVGLRGTGDKGRETQKRISMLMQRMRFNVDPADLPSKNVALVMVTARIKSDTPKGTRLDVTVSSLGDAASLAGGELLPTPLHADNPEIVYARAQGAVAVGAGGHPTSGAIAGGGAVEQEIASNALDRFYVDEEGRRVYYIDLVISADRAGFRVASEVADAINTALRSSADAPAARALSSTEVRVEVPRQYEDRRVAFVSDEVMNSPVVIDPPARLIINERTGVVVATGSVRISPADIVIGNRRIVIEKEGTMAELKEAIGRLANRQDYMASSAEFIAVVKELARAGALHAELVSR
jgi:flagellar P-ring protein precursor FlgI